MANPVEQRADETPDPEPPGWRRYMPRFRAAPLRRLGAAVIDHLYPPLCVACNQVTGTPATLCASCWATMPFISRPYCERLGTPFAVDIGGALLSPAAMADPPVFERARSVALHKGAAKEMVHKLKYGDRLELAVAMGRMMRGSGQALIADADLLVPVPLHWTRLLKRRFNQATALARIVAETAGKPLDTEALIRRKRTATQVRLTKTERQQNLQGALTVPDAALARISGRRILLIDDVMTTGSTANACARALLKAGATGVDVLTFSRVVTGLE